MDTLSNFFHFILISIEGNLLGALGLVVFGAVFITVYLKFTKFLSAKAVESRFWNIMRTISEIIWQIVFWLLIPFILWLAFFKVTE